METVEESGKKQPKRPNTTGSVVPEDEGLSLWLARFWSRDEVPERVEVYQLFGRNKAVRGERIYVQMFKPNEKLNIEQANKIANEIVESTQNDADALRQPGNYQVAMVDRNRGANPTIRRLGPIHPKRTYVVNGDEALAEDADDGTPGGKQLALTYAQESLQAVRWERSRNDQVLGQVIQLLIRRLESSEGQIDKLITKHFQLIEVAEKALDRSADRETLREREKFKLGMQQDGWSMAKNLMPGLFESGRKALAGKKEDEGPVSDGAIRQLVENFMTDVERAGEELLVKLFGDYEEKEGKLHQKSEGVFTLQQFSILMKVREGKLPVDELEKLMPRSGDELEITDEQVKAAMAAGVTSGMATALFEMVGMLGKRKEHGQTST